MSGINIRDFSGRVPRRSSKLLAPSQAQVATNCDLQRGKVAPFKALNDVKSLGSALARTIYKHYVYWRAWSGDVDVVPSEITQSNKRIFYTGDGYPKQTDDTLAGFGTSISQSKRLGIVPPTTPLTLSLSLIDPAEDYGEVFDTVSYYYTLVTSWGEESAPSPVSAVVDVRRNEKVTLRGFSVASAVGSSISSYRVYRLSTGTEGAQYQLVPRLYDGNGHAIYDMPISYNTFYDVDDEEKTLRPYLGEICPSEEWTPPPANMQGLVQMMNGVLAGFYGNTVYISEPLYPYAWPYSRTVAHDIVAMGVFNNALVVATEVYPYIIRGSDPESMEQIVIDCEQGCLSKRGLVSTNVGVIYPSPDGLVLINGLQWDLLTKNLYTREQWLALGPEKLISFYYNDRYFGFFEGTNEGIIIDFKESPCVVDISLPTGSLVYGGFVDAEDDTLYLLVYTSGSYYIQAWHSHATSNLTADWKSAVFSMAKYVNFACAMVVGDDGGSVTFKLYADGVLQHSATVATNEMFRLPSGFLYRECEIEIIGTTHVDIVLVGETPADVAG